MRTHKTGTHRRVHSAARGKTSLWPCYIVSNVDVILGLIAYLNLFVFNVQTTLKIPDEMLNHTTVEVARYSTCEITCDTDGNNKLASAKYVNKCPWPLYI